jgi:hypothetical protein
VEPSVRAAEHGGSMESPILRCGGIDIGAAYVQGHLGTEVFKSLLQKFYTFLHWEKPFRILVIDQQHPLLSFSFAFSLDHDFFPPF